MGRALRRSNLQGQRRLAESQLRSQLVEPYQGSREEGLVGRYRGSYSSHSALSQRAVRPHLHSVAAIRQQDRR